LPEIGLFRLQNIQDFIFGHDSPLFQPEPISPPSRVILLRIRPSMSNEESEGRP
jgi:hypothetical protein